METISLVVSTYNKPMHLRGLLASLAVQTYNDDGATEIIITDNSDDARHKTENMKLATEFKVNYIHVGAQEPYTSAERGARIATKKWLGFPSDDCYYTPIYVEQMLLTANLNNADVVYCDCVYDARYRGHYSVMDVSPVMGAIDKGGFIMRRGDFTAFPGKAPISFSDGLYIEELVRAGRIFTKAPGVLWVHN